MPFALVTIGLILIVSGARDTYAALGKELIEDFTGEGNFLYWLLAIGALGALGAIPQFRTMSRAFMALIIISMVIANRGFAAKFSEAIEKGPVYPGDTAKTVGSGSTITGDKSKIVTPSEWLNFARGLRAENDATAAQNFGKFMDAVKLFI